jgi:hypothetical protein
MYPHYLTLVDCSKEEAVIDRLERMGSVAVKYCPNLQTRHRARQLFNASYMNRYYDIDAILTDSQRIPCTFELDVPRIGYLVSDSQAGIQRGSKVELPLWIAEMLAIQ